MLQAAEKRKQKKLVVLQKLYENLEKRVVPDKELNYDLLHGSRLVYLKCALQFVNLIILN